MANVLAAKLQNFAPLSDGDIASLDELCRDVRPYRARRDLIKQGNCPEYVYLLVEGWACRYKVLPDGNRQIMAYLVPGDLCDIHIFILNEMDHSVGLLCDARVAAIPGQKMLDLFDRSEAIRRALWWSTLTDEAVLREWLVNVGQRDAYERLAHLLVELWYRLDMVGLIRNGFAVLPVTQTDLADTLGLTPVHTNRMIQRLRQDGLIELTQGRLKILNLPKLKAASRFDPSYLHLSKSGFSPAPAPSG